MQNKEITILHLYPELLNLYGDKGNISALSQRLLWRNIDVNVIECTGDDKIDFSLADIVFLGGAADREQEIVCDKLIPYKEELKKYNSEDIYVIGGEQIYKALVDDCDVAHITKINFAYDADAYFPNLDEKPEWQISADSEELTYFDLEFFFYKYEKIK